MRSQAALFIAATTALGSLIGGPAQAAPTAPAPWCYGPGGVLVRCAEAPAQPAPARKPDIKQFDDAVMACERQIGRKLTPDERRQLHDAISDKGGAADYGYIVRTCVFMFG